MRSKRLILGLVLVLVTSAIALGGCQGDKARASLDGEITIGIAQDLEDGLDPHVVNAAGTKEILFNVYEGLVKYDSQGNLNDAIAESHVISDDGLTYTFNLRKGVKFHDGSELKASDVVYSINRCKDNEYVKAFASITSISNTEDQVVITLAEPNADFLAYMTTAIIQETNTDPNSSVIGTGPYKFESHTPQEMIVLKAFEDYYGDKAHIGTVNLKICANPDAITMELVGGSIDMFCRVTSNQVAELQNSDFEILEGTMNLVQALYLNNNVEPFNDVRVRQALCYAIDPQEIMVYVSDGKGTEIGSSMFPSFGKYYDAALNDKYNQDIDKAKELLAEAGYPDGFEFSISVPSNYEPHVATAQVLKEQFKAIGVTANLNLIEWDSWLSDVYTNREFESTVIGVDASPLTARALLERFTSTNGKNFINFNSTAYDQKFAEAIKMTDDAEQTAAFKGCLEILADEAANVYIQDLPEFVAINKKYAGYEFYPLYVQDFSKLYIVEK